MCILTAVLVLLIPGVAQAHSVSAHTGPATGKKSHPWDHLLCTHRRVGAPVLRVGSNPVSAHTGSAGDKNTPPLGVVCSVLTMVLVFLRQERSGGPPPAAAAEAAEPSRFRAGTMAPDLHPKHHHAHAQPRELNRA